ncbi:hypothetical protein XO10_01240 [Marinitoga sp. 1135]|uniref:hypothetical protein n=1 Tax=Marinitoga sp. 1135 TaxID=1643333 RepID=UPI001586B680|nr:hypothetical protein [Marinitoga sp. 1135]NUU94932.1 hypothetical protein [Marinitoga sp. 1135]
MVNEIMEYINSQQENVSTDDIKRYFNLSDSDWNIIYPFLLSNGVKINTFESMNLTCESCPLKGFCNKKSCGG